ncbi:MAG: HAMP domain-containing protein [Spirulina sp. SIO3F2]|nr:HAMP domain-containing protein [Spirulina sp. SIO3F2]
MTWIITGLVMGIVGVTTIFSIQQEQKYFRTELEYQAQVLLDTLELTLTDPLYRLDADLLRESMSQLGEYQALLTVGSIYDAQGYLLADANSAIAIYTTEVDPIGRQLVQSSTTMVDWYTEELRIGRAIIVGRKPIGAIQIGLSTTSVQQQITAVRNRGIAIAILATIVGAALAQWISRSITRPVQALMQGTQQLATGNFEHRITLSSQDELSILAHAFNEMGAKLQKTVHLLGEKNQDLEQRTQELTQTLEELQNTQAQLIQSEKMSSLGQLVAGIAHEINNPINFIHGNIEYLEEHAQDLLDLLHLYQKHTQTLHPDLVDKLEEIDLSFLEKDLANLLRSMHLGTQRITDIVLSLRNFSRLDEADLKMADLHEGLDSTLMLLQHRLQANEKHPEIQVQRNYGNIPRIACYPGQLNQVFMNILANAIDALEERKKECLYQDIEADPHIIQINTHCSSSNWLIIKIQDNGPGIPEQLQSRLFDPFFTTKAVGRGTGLGLSISYRIITDTHHGKLSCQSVFGEGTVFFIELPPQTTASYHSLDKTEKVHQTQSFTT